MPFVAQSLRYQVPLVLMAMLIAASTVSAGPIIKNIVLEGGGVYGPAHIGVLSVCETRPDIFQPEAIIGTSVGALIGSAFAVGYNAAQILSFNPPSDANTLRSNLTLVGYNMINGYGMINAAALVGQLNYLFSLKTGFPQVTFGQLATVPGKLDLTVVVVNANTMEVEYLNKNTAPNMSIAEAVRASASVPFASTSPVYSGSHYIDGGVRNPFPFNYFSEQGTQVLRRTLGSAFVPNVDYSVITNVDDFIGNMLKMMQENNLPNFRREHAIDRRTISTQMPAGVRSTDPVATAASIALIHQLGVDSATAFFADPDCPFHV